MTRAEAIALVVAEIDRAESKFPGWPSDPVHAAAVVCEESGELMQAALNHTYQWGDGARMLPEAVQAAAMAIRFIVGYGSGHYEKRPDTLPKVAT